MINRIARNVRMIAAALVVMGAFAAVPAAADVPGLPGGFSEPPTVSGCE